MTKILTVLLLFLYSPVFGQTFFDWSTGSENTGMAFQYLASHPEGVVAGAEISALNYTRDTPKYLQADGKESIASGYSLNQSGHQVLFFDKKGIVLWNIQFDRDLSSLRGIAVKDNGDIVLLVYVKYYDEDEMENPVGYLPRNITREPQPAGYTLLYVSSSGKVKKIVPAQNLNPEVSGVTSFRMHPNGYLVLGGEANPGKPALNLDQKALDGGGDFVMMLDTNGMPRWVDVISYRAETCCSRLAQNNSLSITPDGTIYFGGTYKVGGIFSNGHQTMTPKKYDQKHDGYEAYVVSYTPEGEINWINTYQEQSVLYALQGTDDGVFAAHKTHGGLAFGLPADTTNNKINGLTYMNRKGKVKWNKMLPVTKTEAMALDEDGEVIVVHSMKYNYRGRVSTLAGTELPDRTDIIITSIDKDEEMEVLKPGKLLIESRNDPILISRDNDGNLFLAGLVHCGLPIDLKLIDESLPKIECYGGVAILGLLDL